MSALTKVLASVIEEGGPKAQKMLQGLYRGFAGGNAAGAEKVISATPQRSVADYYANKRALQTGEDPHVEMLMVDPFVGGRQGHSTLGTGANPPMFTNTHIINPEDVESSTSLYAQGGHVQPSEAQIAAGNYKKGHVWAHGLNISIENPADSVRSGKNAKGDEWHTRMQHDYGYIKGTKGSDKDHVDVFLGPDFKDRQVPVHVIDQHNEDGKFDEHKVMMGFKTPEEAKEAYLGNYHDGWDGAKAITPMHVDDFKQWVTDKSKTTKPAAESSQNFAGGGSVVDRDRQQRQQMEHSNQVIKQMARGWLAGTVGMPGDLEGLVRHLIPGVSNTSFLPTSDFYKEWLPGASEDPRLQQAADVGSWTGGMGAGPLVKGAASIATKAGLPLVEHAGQMLNAGMHGEGALSKVLAPAQPAFAVKPKGGNWTSQPGYAPDDVLDYHDIVAHNTSAPNAWRYKQLTNYIKNQMGTTDDPLLKLEQEGRLHMTPQQMEELAPEYGSAPYPAGDTNDAYRVRPNSSKADKFHFETTGRNYRTPWENLSDNAIGRHTPAEELGHHLDMSDASPESNTIEKAIAELRASGHPDADYLKQYQWLDKVDPKTPIYGVGDPQGLGFQHMMDYMDQANAAGQAFEHHGSLEAMRKAAENAVPNAPIHDFIPLVERNLHLSDADVARSSVSDIAAKTGEWNKVLAQTKTLRAQAQVPDFKTYDSGHVWKAVPDTSTSDDGLNFALNAGKDAGWCTQATSLAQHYGGNGNQLYILHDAAGKPKVQIAVKPGQSVIGNPENYRKFSELSTDDASNFDEYSKSIGNDPGHLRKLEDTHLFNPESGSIIRKEDINPPASIQEIKGRMNRKPDPEDLPMVQDFIKSGQWSRVGDLQNSNLRKTSDVFNPIEQQKITEAGGQIGEYHTPDEIAKFCEMCFPEIPPEQNFAKGGHVHGLINIDTYAHNEPIPPQVMQALVRRFGPHLTMRQVLDTFKKEANGGHPYSTKKKLVDWAMSHK